MFVGRLQHAVYQLHNLQHVLFLEAAGSDGRRANAKAGGGEGATAVEGHHVLVHGNIGTDQFFLCDAACQVREVGA